MLQELLLLLVEDSPDDAELLVLELQNGGFSITWKRVESRQSLKEALQSGHWDLVISDFVMLDFNGLDALKIVRRHDPHLPFILVSGAIGEKLAVNLMKEGAQDYILKNNLMRLSTVVMRELEESKMRRKALKDERELIESNERLMTIFNGTSEFMCFLRVLEDDFFIESVNDAFMDAYKYYVGKETKENLTGIRFTDFLRDRVNYSDERIEYVTSRYRAIADQNTARNFVERLIISGTSIYTESQINPITEDGVCTHILIVAKNVTDAVIAQKKLEEAYLEVEKLKTQLEIENLLLKEEIKITQSFDDIIYASEALEAVLLKAEQVAPVDATVLITGETGTGKELVVKAIHDLSSRREEKFIKINCAALPRDLIESELFGHEKGAFTGADTAKLGRFELAHKGTIFLDEIGELPVSLQAKLLRVLQEGEFDRLGGTESVKVDVRVIAATNKDLKKAIKEGEFREDLYYRINVFPIHVPPLRERKADIGPLVSYFVKKYGKKFNKSNYSVTASAIRTLENYHWPGNVRELENLVERAMIISKNGELTFPQLSGKSDTSVIYPAGGHTSLKQMEKFHLVNILEQCDWRINGEGGAADLLELTPSTLRDRMRKLGIVRPER